jgi:hypothetical protein
VRATRAADASPGLEDDVGDQDSGQHGGVESGQGERAGSSARGNVADGDLKIKIVIAGK